MHPAIIAATALFGALAFRLRGGGWVALGSTTICRLIWSAAMLAIYLVVAYPTGAPWYSLYLVTAAFCSMLVPHAFAQNMGTWPNPQKRWPAFFLPTLLDSEWSSMPMWARVLYDFGGMLGVGFFRGLIVFGAFVLFWVGGHKGVGGYADLGDLIGASLRQSYAWATITILQPMAYLLGRFMPITITSGLVARTNTWGEFFNGAAWVIAMAVL